MDGVIADECGEQLESFETGIPDDEREEETAVVAELGVDRVVVDEIAGVVDDRRSVPHFDALEDVGAVPEDQIDPQIDEPPTERPDRLGWLCNHVWAEMGRDEQDIGVHGVGVVHGLPDSLRSGLRFEIDVCDPRSLLVRGEFRRVVGHRQEGDRDVLDRHRDGSKCRFAVPTGAGDADIRGLEHVEGIQEGGLPVIEGVIVGQTDRVHPGCFEGRDGPIRVGAEVKPVRCLGPWLPTLRETALEVADRTVESPEAIDEVAPDRRRWSVVLCTVDSPAEHDVARQSESSPIGHG